MSANLDSFFFLHLCGLIIMSANSFGAFFSQAHLVFRSHPRKVATRARRGVIHKPGRAHIHRPADGPSSARPCRPNHNLLASPSLLRLEEVEQSGE